MEMKLKYTQGPWIICYDGKIEGKNSSSYFTTIVCTMPFETYKEFNEYPEIKANSYLISAAPALYEAASKLLQTRYGTAKHTQVSQELHNAVAKAEGKKLARSAN